METDAADCLEWLRKNESRFKALLGPDKKKRKTSAAVIKLEPTASIKYAAALRRLEAVCGGVRFSEQEFRAVLESLGYAFENTKGDRKGSGNDYMKVLASFASGKMKSSLQQSTGLDVSECNFVHTSLAETGPLRKKVRNFESDTGNTGHGRMEHALPFVLVAQMQRLSRSLEPAPPPPEGRPRERARE